MSDFGWKPYVSVAHQRRQAAERIAKLRKKGRSVAPVTIDGRMIAASFWGKSWCDNLQRYSDFATRLPRGRSYVRNGFVLDLQIAKGEVRALVSGSDIYDVKIAVTPVVAQRWQAICRDCTGGIDSLVELLQGRLAKGVMDRVCRAGDGLFPAPNEIKLSCSCPDWADMCKHVAAVLYGVGARLDQEPQLMFVLRGVDVSDLLAGAGQDMTLTRSAPGSANILQDGDMAALFGLDMAEDVPADAPAPAAPKPVRRATTPEAGNDDVASKRADKASPRPARGKAGPTGKTKVVVAMKPMRKRTKGSV